MPMIIHNYQVCARTLFMIWLLGGVIDARSRRRLLCLIINAIR
jgi:hypothetical protein